MSKKQSLFSLILALCLCMVLAMPALAAEDNIEIIDEHYLVKTNIDTAKVTLEDNNISTNGENKQIAVNIISSEVEKEVSSADIANAYDKAMESYKRDMTFDSNGNPDGTFNYTLVGEDEIYFYEQTANSPMQADMDVICLTQEDKAEMKSEYAQRLLNDMPVPYSSHGYYAKMYINNTTRNYSSCTITLPKSDEVSTSTSKQYGLFIYGGFSGGSNGGSNTDVEADLGLMYNNPEMDVWKCFMTIVGGGDFLDTRQGATWKNGYLPGEKITIVCMPYNNSTNIDNSGEGSVGTVVLKAYGMARYADKYGTGTSTKLTSVMESENKFNFTKVANHKWVTTIGGNANSVGYNIGTFTNISINGTIQPDANFKTTGDGTYNFSNKGLGSITMTIKH